MQALARSFVLALASFAATSSSLARQAQFIPLGDLPGSSFRSEANGVSANGSVVVGVGSSASSEAFRWKAAGGMVGLGVLLGGGTRSFANGINENGSVVVGWSTSAPAPSPNGEAFRWTVGSGMMALGDFPGGSFNSRAEGVSANGTVVVGFGDSAQGNMAFRWTTWSAMVGLGDLPGGSTWSRALGVSSDGLVVVGSSSASTGVVAFRWTTSSGMVGLGLLPGHVTSLAFAANVDGSVIVGASKSPAGTWEAFRWTASGGMTGLGADTQALGVSAVGSSIVGRVLSVLGHEAFLWSPSLGLVDLRDLLISMGASGLGGWTLQEARAISADGNAIVGLGTNPSGQVEAWLAYLTPPILSLGTNYCGPVVPNSTGLYAVMSASGSQFVSDNDVTLFASQVPPGQFGYFLISRTPGFFNPPNSGGFICVSGPVGRFNAPGQVTQGPVISARIDLSNLPLPVGQQTMPGDTLYFQAWYRDIGNTNNFSDGLEITFL